MKLVRAEEAVGKRLAMDYSIVTPQRKGAMMQRGQVVREEDVAELKANGHYFVYVFDDQEEEDIVFEDEAVKLLANYISSGPLAIEAAAEGKALIRAKELGLLDINSQALANLNSQGVFAVITRKKGSFLKEGELAAIVDLIPLYLKKQQMEDLLRKIEPYGKIIHFYKVVKPKISILIVGNEIVDGLKKDIATPIVKNKLAQYSCVSGEVDYARDDVKEIAEKIEALLKSSDGLIAVGGMSVDPTDKTPQAIASLADEVVAYGIPMKPTTMTMVAYSKGKPVIGVSSGLIHFPEFNALDVLLPWVSSARPITKDFLYSLGEGGLSEYFLSKMSFSSRH